MQEPTCPKCGRTEDIRTSHVPLGHGRHSLHVCPHCRIIFEWGYNKFGNIENVNQVERVKDLRKDEKVEDVKQGEGKWRKLKEDERLDNKIKKTK